MTPGPISRIDEYGGEDPPKGELMSLLQQREAEAVLLYEALKAARLSLYKIANNKKWKAIDGSIPAAMAQEAGDGLEKVNQLAPPGF